MKANSVRSAAGAQPFAAPRRLTLGRARFGFILAIVAQTLMMAGASAPSPFYPVLADDVGFDTSIVGIIFAVYAVALLLTLLSAGSLSDYVGRPIMSVIGFIVLGVSLLLFGHAGSVTLLLLARVVQGVGTGLLLSTLSAAVLDFTPVGRERVSALWNALAPGIGLAFGALVSGVALQLLDASIAVVFSWLAAVYFAIAASFLFVPGAAPRRHGAWASLGFRLSIPAAVRGDFWRAAPAVIAGWATGGLFMSLGANIVRDEPGGASHLLQALPVVLLTGVGALAAFAMRRRSAHVTMVFGAAVLALGTASSLVALGVSALGLYLAAVAVTGLGFGTAFAGVLASLTPHIPDTDRADTFAVIFTMAYLSFSVPSVIAGALAPLVGLATVCIGYGLTIIVLALTALVLCVRRPGLGRVNND